MSSIRLPYLHQTCAIAMGIGLALGAGQAEDIYKSVDAQGHVVYSDRPLPGNAERVTIQSKPRDDAKRHKARKVSTQNIALSIAVLVAMIPLAVLGAISVATAVVVHEVAELLAVANGTRAGSMGGKPGAQAK